MNKLVKILSTPFRLFCLERQIVKRMKAKYILPVYTKERKKLSYEGYIQVKKEFNIYTGKFEKFSFEIKLCIYKPNFYTCLILPEYTVQRNGEYTKLFKDATYRLEKR